jgi:hypothetical protein
MDKIISPVCLAKGISAKCITNQLASDITVKDNGRNQWFSPTHLVPKKNGQWQLVKLRGANKVTVREHYPIPAIRKLHLELNGSQLYSKLNTKYGLSSELQ